jgi:hypothetical protein
MYGEGTGTGALAVTGVGMTIGGVSFGLPALVVAAAVLVVAGILLIRLAGRNRRYVP